MRIVIDLQGAQGSSRHRGIGRYSLEFALAVARNRGENDVVIALSGLFPETIEGIRAAFEGLLPSENVQVWHGLDPAVGRSEDDRSRRELSKLLREAFLERLEPDIVHLTSLFEGFGDNAVHSVPHERSYITSSTFYDLIPLNNAELYLDPNPGYKSFYLDIVSSLLSVDLHLSISEYSKTELQHTLDVPREKIRNVYAGVGDKFKKIVVTKELRDRLSKFGITKPFLMYSGAADERKNHVRLIEAFAQSRAAKSCQLVLAGRIPDDRLLLFKRAIEDAGLSERDVIITNTVTDDELILLYNTCLMFVFPAWQEGFGLPLVEAMRCGAPVLGSSTSSIPEVIGRADALFDPLDVLSIRDAIDRAVADPDFLAELRVYGLERAGLFSWDRVGEDAVRFYEEVFEGRKESRAVEQGASHLRSRAALSQVNHRAKAINSVGTFLSELKARAGKNPGFAGFPTHPAIGSSDMVATSKAIALNHPILIQKQMLIDVSELVKHDARTGIQRVVRSVIFEMINNPPSGYSIELVYANTNEPGYRYARSFRARMFGGIYSPLPDDFVDVSSGDIFLGLDLQHHVVLQQGKTFDLWRSSGVKVYFVVYDLLPVLMPEKFPAGAEQIHDEWLTAISACDGLICISRSVADEVCDWLDLHGVSRQRSLKVGWFHLGADVMQSMPSRGTPLSHQLLDQLRSKPTFIMVGTIEPRKGHYQTLGAFELLWKKGVDVNLVIVGKQGWNVEDIVENIEGSAEFGKRLHWLPAVSDEGLEALYASADCLIAASEGEGFGLPLVEAAQHGLHVFARSIPVFHELAGDTAFYFAGSDASSMELELTNWLELFRNKSAPNARAMKWLTWKKSTQQLVSRLTADSWYRTWTKAIGWNYVASDRKLCTAVANRVGQELHSSGKEGFFLYGPFISLPRGDYEVSIFGSNVGGRADYDLAGDGGKILIQKGSLLKQSQWGKLLSCRFTVTKDVDRFEVRIVVDRHAHLNVSRLEILPLATSPSASALDILVDA